MRLLASLFITCILGLTTAAYAEQVEVNTLTNETTSPRPDANYVATPKEDAIITESIKKNIANSSMLSDLNVNVETNKGVVTLTGKVDSDSQASSLIELAESTIGVRDVDAANLEVKESSQPFQDMLITAKVKGTFIREELFGTKDIASVNLSVETKDGIVYLTGVIDDQKQIDNAIAMVKKIDGVKKVEYKVTKVDVHS